ncbi:hypothetical protein GCM10010520_62930 [Rhizobium viscosum]|uniref:Class 3 adenylate cyclase n=1 Tax=Rhizobium viscosum TaxID=1673 RepID=A0ABR9IV03_RHIVS|nr:class 3 adenylate cyclase [Rhizobium viscosum]
MTEFYLRHKIAGQPLDIGIHAGDVQIGAFSSFHSNFTVIGGVVNQAVRLESQAAPGEILVSRETTLQAPELMSGTQVRPLLFKGL